MKKTIATFLAISLMAAPSAFAQQPINLKDVKPVRHSKCLNKIAVTINGQPYAFSRLQGIEYTKADGTRVTVADPAHPWNNCDLNNIGEVTRFSTGVTKSGVNIHIDNLTDENAKKKFVTTYADRRDAILEKLEKNEVKLMDDYTNLIRWKTSVMYTLPGSIKTENEEPVAVYCKLPPGVQDLPSVPREEKRKFCSTRYLLPGGLGFGYDYVEGIREYKLTELDKSIRAYLEGARLKPVPAEKQAP